MGLRQFKIALFTFVCILFVLKSNAQLSQDEKHIEVSLRMIGHQVLLGSGDSISRILPIKKEGDRYRIQFQSKFEFYPGELVSTINKVVSQTRMSTSYIVEVEQCNTGEVVYSYEINDLEQTNLIPCKSRMQPKACYSLLFTLMGPVKPIKSLAVTQAASKQSAFTAEQLTYSILSLLLIFIIGVIVFLWMKRRNTIVDPNLIPLGAYQFNKRNTELLFKDQRTELTGKEADLLLLLYNAVNTSVEREVILNKVWGDEGDYVGRTLDVFISKLRKKFEEDPKVKIVNIRGVGYKLVIGV